MKLNIKLFKCMWVGERLKLLIIHHQGEKNLTKFYMLFFRKLHNSNADFTNLLHHVVKGSV